MSHMDTYGLIDSTLYYSSSELDFAICGFASLLTPYHTSLLPYYVYPIEDNAPKSIAMVSLDDTRTLLLLLVLLLFLFSSSLW